MKYDRLDKHDNQPMSAVDQHDAHRQSPVAMRDQQDRDDKADPYNQRAAERHRPAIGLVRRKDQRASKYRRQPELGNERKHHKRCQFCQPDGTRSYPVGHQTIYDAKAQAGERCCQYCESIVEDIYQNSAFQSYRIAPTSISAAACELPTLARIELVER